MRLLTDKPDHIPSFVKKLVSERYSKNESFDLEEYLAVSKLPVMEFDLSITSHRESFKQVLMETFVQLMPELTKDEAETILDGAKSEIATREGVIVFGEMVAVAAYKLRQKVVVYIV